MGRRHFRVTERDAGNDGRDEHQDDDANRRDDQKDVQQG